jgi:hypothetical protein
MGEEYSTQSVVRKLEEISDGTPSRLEDNIKVEQINTERFIMFSVITNIYNKKAKGPALMELFTATVKLKEVFFLQLEMLWQELEYRIDVCHVTRGAHIEHL